MLTATILVQRYFPEEKIVRSFKAELHKEKQNVFGIPISYFSSMKPIVSPKIEIIETANFWFIDLRYQRTIWKEF